MKEVDTTGWITLPDHPYPPTPAASTGTPRAGRARSRAPEVVPRQLPGSVRDFTGRAEHLATLNALIPPDPDENGLKTRAARSVVITAVDGTGGIGKTTLALHWAHQAQARFPDSTLHMNLRGYGPGTPARPLADSCARWASRPARSRPTLRRRRRYCARSWWAHAC
ncbi:hypothetical protein [Amycolatopsis sp. H20-H5]|uniref:hypothetical protein n=1 Tax=Amycolatopsis sp. H20-H5 TaxID=3046309 RepID=UPI002DBEB1BF|nr:hypothetical protein [Amycolatopsis sp. H20-H5]MEC3980848.1 hypothetical protein [Amycolatopsis sp. H20-H5]